MRASGPPMTTTDGVELLEVGSNDAERSAWSWRWALAAGGLYLLLSIGLWWNVWSTQPSSVTVCGCGDAARFLWFFEWPAFALTHGHSPLWSDWLNHPIGINLLNDTSVLGLGIPLAPLTLLLGPVVSMNVALTLAPAASALAMYALARRFTAFQPTAILLGLAYGFSTFVIDPSASGQLNLSTLVVPPLVALLLDDLLRGRRLKPIAAGLLLAVLVVWQFFLSPEVLLITGFACVAFAIPLWISVRRDGPHVLRHVGLALGTAAAASTVLLAYPIWFYFGGHAHLSGAIWGAEAKIWQWGSTPKSLLLQSGSPYGSAIQRFFGSYSGADLPSYSYLGTSFVVVGVAGLLLRRRDRTLQLFFGIGFAAVALSMTPVGQPWAPWGLLRHLPLLDSVAEYRFTFVALICLLVVVGRSLEGLWSWLGARTDLRTMAARISLAGLLALAMLLPNLLVLKSNLPLSANPVGTPRWFTTYGEHLPPGQVLLVYPDPVSGLQASQAWQADTHMAWKQAGVGGPAGTLARAGRGKVGVWDLTLASNPINAPIDGLLATWVRQARRSMAFWGVTRIVLPEQERLGFGQRGRPTTWAIAFFTALTGAAPVHQADAWVWRLSWPMQKVDSELLIRFRLCNKAIVPSTTAAQVLTCMSAPPQA